MILVDTSVWIDHLRTGDKVLSSLLDTGTVLTHPFIVGELALGHLRQREVVLDALSNLPCADIATDAEVLGFIDRHALSGSGIGYVDVHLLAAARLTPDAKFWTNDKRLHDTAVQLELAATLP